MPINISNINIIVAFGTSLVSESYASPQNLIYLTRSGDNRTGILALNGYSGGNNSIIEGDTLIWSPNATTAYLSLSDFMSPTYNVFISGMSNQANPWKELWASASITTYQNSSIGSAFPKLINAGSFIAGSSIKTVAINFTSSNFFRIIEESFSESIGIIIIGKLGSNGHVLREYASITNYILRHEQNSTAAHTLGCTIQYIKKNGIEVFPQTAGDVYNLFSDGFNLIEIKVSGVNIPNPQINITGDVEEYIIHQ